MSAWWLVVVGFLNPHPEQQKQMLPRRPIYEPSHIRITRIPNMHRLLCSSAPEKSNQAQRPLLHKDLCKGLTDASGTAELSTSTESHVGPSEPRRVCRATIPKVPRTPISSTLARKCFLFGYFGAHVSDLRVLVVDTLFFVFLFLHMIWDILLKVQAGKEKNT